MAEYLDPLEAGLAIARAFEAHAVSYALGGALAYGVWGIPRGTVDIDVNVFVEDEALDRVAAALQALGISIDTAQARSDSAARGMFMTRFGIYRLDVFTPSIAFSWEAERTRVRVDVGGESTAWFLSAEALAVFKLLFFRPKDLVDLERLVAVQGARLDAHYVRTQLVELVGADDERIARWDSLQATARS